MRTTIRGDRWKVEVVSKRRMKELSHLSTETAGLCNKRKKVISLSEKYFSEELVRHELFHAYAWYLYLEDTNEMSVEDLEEIYATLFENDGMRIAKQAKQIYKALK